MKRLIRLSAFSFLAFSAVAWADFTPLEVGDTAPCVVLDGIDSEGNATTGCIRDPEKESQTHTLVEFFSIVCSDCLENLPKVGKLHEDLQDVLQVRLIATDGNVDRVKEFIAERNIHEAVAFDANKLAMLSYGVFFTPQVFILDRDNKVVFKHGGVLTEEALNEIHSIVGKPAPEVSEEN